MAELESKVVKELQQAAYLRGLRVASDLAEDHGVAWLRGYVTGVAVGHNEERHMREEVKGGE